MVVGFKDAGTGAFSVVAVVGFKDAGTGASIAFLSVGFVKFREPATGIFSAFSAAVFIGN